MLVLLYQKPGCGLLFKEIILKIGVRGVKYHNEHFDITTLLIGLGSVPKEGGELNGYLNSTNSVPNAAN